MLTFTKTPQFKIIALTVAATLFFESAVYGTDLSDVRYLRVPMASCIERADTVNEIQAGKQVRFELEPVSKGTKGKGKISPLEKAFVIDLASAFFLLVAPVAPAWAAGLGQFFIEHPIMLVAAFLFVSFTGIAVITLAVYYWAKRKYTTPVSEIGEEPVSDWWKGVDMEKVIESEEEKDSTLTICVGSTRYASIGGLQYYLKELYEEIAKRIKVRIHILYFTMRKKIEASVQNFGSNGVIVLHPIYQQPGYFRYVSPTTMFAVLRELAGIRRKDGIDLVHLHDPYIPILAVPYLIFKMQGIPFITTFHLVLEWIWSWKWIATRILLRFIHPLLGRKFGVSTESAKMLGRKSEVIGRLVDASFFDPEKANPQAFLKANELEGVHIILYPARIEPMKGQIDLVEVAKYMKDKKDNRSDLDFKIVIIGPVGDSLYFEEIRQSIEFHNLEDYVIILPAVLDEEYRDAIASADIVSISSYSEGLSLAALHALSMEKPVVANRVGGIPEAVIDGETGFLVEPHHTEEMADRIIYLLDHPEVRQEMGEKGREFVMENYSVEGLVERHLELYSQLTKRDLHAGI